jgi:hypothetical protein
MARRIPMLLVAAALVAAAPVADGMAVFGDAGASPLSGLPGGAGRPVVMVKLDNTGPARPHTGLREADLVYVEEVEWGVTRLAAMYNSSLPKVVGPVRSARISDLEILEQFQRPGLAYSGANDAMVRLIRRSNAASLSPAEKSGFFYRDKSKEVPNNQMLKLAGMVGSVRNLSPVEDIGLTFDPAAPAGGQPVRTFLVKWPNATVGGAWDRSGFSIEVDGYVQRDKVTKRGVVARTVVIQFVEQGESRFGDRFGGKTPLVKTVGSGTAIVLRNGARFDATWSRPSADAGTSFLVAGQPLPFDVGQVWVLLVDRRKPQSVIVR